MILSRPSFIGGLAAICCALAQAAPQATTSAAAPLCTPEAQGIVQPANGATVTQTQDSNYDGTIVEIVYCSGQYFKTSTIDASVLLTLPGSPDSGQLLAKDVAPDNLDALAGFYSYRFNVTIAPISGTYPTGPYTLSIYETTTGYYNPTNFEITSINVTLVVADS